MASEQTNSGSPESIEECLAPILAQYPVLRKIAASEGARVGARTLQATAIVNEALIKIMRMVESGKPLPQDPEHQLALCARVIQQVAVDDYRRRKRDRRGGGQRPANIEEVRPPMDRSAAKPDVDLEAVDLAIQRFEAKYSERRKELVVFRLMYFQGMTETEVANALDVSTRTVGRYMVTIRAWLAKELCETLNPSAPSGPLPSDGV